MSKRKIPVRPDLRVAGMQQYPELRGEPGVAADGFYFHGDEGDGVTFVNCTSRRSDPMEHGYV